VKLNLTAADDAELAAYAVNGDLDAFEILVRRHTGAVFAHALRFFGDASTADDVVQEVFIKVYRSLDTFNERSRFSTWLYRITRNACIDQVRAGRRRPQPVDPLDITATAPGDLSDQVALSASVETAMRALSPEDRDALSAVSIFGLSYAEAGELLGVPAGTVKSRVFRARRSLSATLGVKRGAA
jgi:RNA polymerase sigma-70 factor, ECF subfamily